MALRRSRPGSRNGVRSPSVFAPAPDWPPVLDEDADLRSGLAALAPAARRQLRDILRWPEVRRNALLRSLVGHVDAEPLCQLLAVAGVDEVARLRLLRAIRDVG